MKAVGLITEYNPLHNGHIYHLNRAREISGADVVIAVMSGNFVQRGEPAIIDKYSRAKAAIDSGINLIVELPTFYALSSAENFARGAVLTLESLKADCIVFGSECGDISALEKCADIFLNEPDDYRAHLQADVAAGLSYPKSRRNALENTYGKSLADITDTPNNILGIEYIKAIKQYALSIKPFTAKRIETGYHDTSLDNTIASATAIRKGILDILQNGDDCLSSYMPKPMADAVKDSLNICTPIVPHDFSSILNYKISLIMLKCNNKKTEFCKELCRYIDVTPDIANRLYAVHKDNMTFSDYADALKNKQYTMTRIIRLSSIYPYSWNG